METLLHKKRKESFGNSLAWVFVILLLTFMPRLHLYASDELTSFRIFGYVYEHGFLDNQAFFWFVLLNLQILQFLLLIFYHCKLSKYLVLFPLYWIINEFFWSILYSDFVKSNTLLLELTYMGIAITISYLTSRFKQSKINIEHQESEGKFNINLGYTAAIIWMMLIFFIRWCQSLPDNTEHLDIIGFGISAHGFGDVRSFLIILSSKLMLFSILLFLYLSVKKWWRYALLFPLLMTTFQIKSVLREDFLIVDEYEIFEALPLLLGVLTIILFLARPAYYQSQLQRLYHKIALGMERKKNGQGGNLPKNRKPVKTTDLKELMRLKQELEGQLKEL